MPDDAATPVTALVEKLLQMVREARALPMSASCVVNRGEVVGLLEDIQKQLPEQLGQACALLADREGVLAQGRVEAEALLEQARAQQQVLVGQAEVHKAAQAEAEALLASAREESEAMRLEVEDYVDGKLANFEVVISKTLAAVQGGRARLHGESELDRLDDAADARPLPG